MKKYLIFLMLIYLPTNCMDNLFLINKLTQWTFDSIINHYITVSIDKKNNIVSLNNKKEIILIIDIIDQYFNNKIAKIDVETFDYEISVHSLNNEKKRILHTRNKEGFSLLDVAVIYRDLDIVKKLLDAGFNINNCNKNINKKTLNIFPSGMWVFDYIYEPINIDKVTRCTMLNFFIDNGYDINLMDANGKSIFSWALNTEFAEIISKEELKELLSILIIRLFKDKNVNGLFDPWNTLNKFLKLDDLTESNIKLINDIIIEKILMNSTSSDMDFLEENSEFESDLISLGDFESNFQNTFE